MSNYRSAMGKTVDMSALAAKNEEVRAVGNAKLNARGDTIDANGRVVKPVTAKVNEMYANTVGNKSAHARRQPAPEVKKSEIIPDLTEFEREIEESQEDDIEVEKIKQAEVEKTTKKESKK
jgi:hypothetical protein